MNKFKLLVFTILLFGIVYRLMMTWNGNFLFNMDNARDMVDVREMVVLGKLRLTGPTSAIEGLFNGPAWYYLLAVPFVLTGGDPYGSIVMEILLWAIGGFFLLKLTSRFGLWAVAVSGSLWIASNYIVLLTTYAFNPNPVTFLTPVLIFAIEKFIKTGKIIYSIIMWILAGAFFNFEMNFGIFIPFIIIFAVLLYKKSLLKNLSFWLSSLAFVATVLPQIFFDLRHQFIMSKSVINFLSQGGSFNPLSRIISVYGSFYSTLNATFMNQSIITLAFLGLFFIYLVSFIKRFKSKEILETICFLLVLIPFGGYILLPVQVNSWHLGGAMVALILLLIIILNKLSKLGLVISLLVIFYALFNIVRFFTHDLLIPNQDPSLFKNEIAAIDYVYQLAEGKNFKVYTYLPSVYDYPYQYLFWWYGKKKYGYIPGEYAYAPNKPVYIPSQDKFQGLKSNFSGLVFLIKEPDRNDTRSGWEGPFAKLETVKKQMVGSLEIEIKREINQ